MLSARNFIITLSLVVTCIITSATAAAILGFFHFFLHILPFILISITVLVLLILLVQIKKRSFNSIKNHSLKTKSDWIVILLILAFSIANGLFYHETVSGARDDGYYSMNAVRLAKTGSIFLTEIRYRPPGVNMIEDSQYSLSFLPSYYSYLALFYAFLGLTGMLICGNSILLWLSLCLLYFISKQLAGKIAGIFTTVLFATNYVTFWFSRRTNNENLTLFLVLLVIVLLLSFLKTKKLYYYLFSIIPLTLLILTRSEALILVFSYLLASLLLFGISLVKRARIKTNPRGLIVALITCFIFGSLVIYSVVQYQNLTKDKYFHSSVASLQAEALDVLDRTKGIVLKRIKEAGIESEEIKLKPVYTDITTFMTPYALDSLSRYFILQVLLIAIVSLAWFRLDAIIILLFLSPYFIGLIYPSITADHPWMMRRYWIAVIPAAYILFNLFLFTSKKISKQWQFLIIIIVVIINLILSSSIISLTEQRGLVKQLQPLAELADKDTLIVLNGDIRGWNAPLYYYYGVNNIDPYGNQSREIPFPKLFGQEFKNSLKSFKKIYLISESKSEITPPLPSHLLAEKDELTLSLIKLTPGALELVKKSMAGEVTEYSIVKSVFPTIPAREIKDSTIHAYIYQLDKERYLRLQK